MSFDKELFNEEQTPENENEKEKEKKKWIYRNRWKVYFASIIILLIVLAGATDAYVSQRGPTATTTAFQSENEFYFSYTGAQVTYLDGFVNASSPNYSPISRLSSSSNSTIFSGYAFYETFLLVLPLSAASNYSQTLYVSELSMFKETFTILNLTSIENTVQEIVQKQGISAEVVFDVELIVYMSMPRSTNETSVLNLPLGQIGLNSQTVGNWMDFKAVNIANLSIYTIR